MGKTPPNRGGPVPEARFTFRRTLAPIPMLHRLLSASRRLAAGLAAGLAAALLALAAPAQAQIGIPQIPGMAIDSTLLRFNPVSQLAAGLGFTTIDGGAEEGQFVLIQLQPELDLRAFGAPQVGLGIDAPLRFQIGGGADSTGAFRFRGEDYDDRNEVLSVLRYVRYGQKGTDGALYARFGAVDFGRIGYGALVEAYRNEVGQDARARGAEFDLDLGGVGVETLYGSFSRPGVYAGRGFLRPLRLMGGAAGGLNDLTIGLTLAGDLNERGGYVNAAAPGEPFFLDTAADGSPTAAGVAGVEDRGTLRAVSLDVGLRLASNGLFNLGLYTNATRFAGTTATGGSGTGGTAGVLLSLAPPEATGTRFDARLEAVYGGAGYLPSVFNAFYEVERLFIVDSVAVPVAGGLPGQTVQRARFQSRRNELAATPAQGGVVAQASAVLLGFLRVEGRYQQLFDTAATGWAHAGADLLLPNNVAFLRAGVDRWNIGGDQVSNSDAQGRNLSMQVEAGLHLTPYLLVGGIAQRAFAPVYAGGRVVTVVRQDRFEPVVRAVLPF